ncbi:hypothetical protein [Paraburkholderia largidicola]|uniref:Uncharacterized protein n=1 Tax=Paraburkholderia largidicola TaxID=3014751 RepID=A0A7I8C6J7_9BURK|nr:hypothetical protein [Paraburkholderia sp. PGU16]BCF95390.1 hypothetical protein PPGU16_84570 [Paraburkholderia sp. PGU16]
MKVALLVMAICALIIGTALAGAYRLHAAWPIIGAGLLVVFLFWMLKVWDRIDQAIEASQEN